MAKVVRMIIVINYQDDDDKESEIVILVMMMPLYASMILFLADNEWDDFDEETILS